MAFFRHISGSARSTLLSLNHHKCIDSCTSSATRWPFHCATPPTKTISASGLLPVSRFHRETQTHVELVRSDSPTQAAPSHRVLSSSDFPTPKPGSHVILHQFISYWPPFGTHTHRACAINIPRLASILLSVNATRTAKERGPPPPHPASSPATRHTHPLHTAVASSSVHCCHTHLRVLS
jgi:hypothetical protein